MKLTAKDKKHLGNIINALTKALTPKELIGLHSSLDHVVGKQERAVEEAYEGLEAAREFRNAVHLAISRKRRS